MGSTARSRAIAATARTKPGRSASKWVIRKTVACSVGANWVAILEK
ncbi:hypothetical protein AB0A70_01025 [Streptomyces morookaense]